MLQIKLKTVAAVLGIAALAGGVTGAEENRLTIPRCPAPPAITGHVSMEKWRPAAELANFQPSDPGAVRGQEADRRAWMSYDEENLYFGFQTSGQNPARLGTAIRDRDGALYTEESVELHLVADDDPATKVQIIVNPSGIIYDARGRDAAWNAAIKAECALNEQGWDAEMAIPWKELGFDARDREHLKFLVVHNQAVDGGVKSRVWSCAATNFHAIERYPALQLAGDGLSGWIGPVEFTGERHPVIRWQLYNPSDRPRNATLTMDFVRGGIIRIDYPPIQATVEVPAGGYAEKVFEPNLEISEPVAAYCGIGDGENGDVLHCLTPIEYRQHSPVGFTVKNYLPIGRIGVATESRLAEAVTVAWNLTAPSGNVVATGEFAAGNGSSVRDFPVAVPKEAGDYRIRFMATLADGTPVEGAAVLPYETPPAWVGNMLGLDHKVSPPFTPVTFADGTLGFVAGTYQLGTGWLPRQADSEGRPLLAGPVRLLAGDGAAAVDLGAIPVAPAERYDDDIVLKGAGTVDGIGCKVEASMQEDGFLWYEVTLSPSAKKIDRLELEIPFRKEYASYIYPIDFGWTNYARTLDGRDWSESFKPSVTVYNDERGLAWYAESQENWNVGAASPLTLTMEPDRAVFRVLMIDRPTDVTEPLKLSFGLQLTPTKPFNRDELYRRPSHWVDYEEGNRDHAAPGSVSYRPAERFKPESGTVALALKLDSGAGTGALYSRETGTFLFGNPEALDGTTDIVTLEDSKGPLVFLTWNQPEKRWKLELRDADNTGWIPLPATATPEVADPNGKWVRLAFTWDGKVVRLIADGKVIAETAQNGLFARRIPVDPEELRLTFGERHANRTSTCYLKSLAVADRALNPDEIRRALAGETVENVVLQDSAAGAIVDRRSAAGGEIYGVLQPVESDGETVWKLFDNFIAYRIRSGASMGNAHQTWAKRYGEPYPVDEPHISKLKTMVEQWHRLGGSVGLYFGGGLSDTSAPTKYYRDLWMAEPVRRWVPDSNTFKSPWANYLDHSFSAGCNGSTCWSDFIAWNIDRVLRDFGIDGLYYDGAMFCTACRNRAHGCGYYDRDGVLRDSYALRQVHRHGKRLYNILMRQRPGGSIYNHYSGSLIPFAGSWSTRLLLGEEYMAQKPGFVVDLKDFRAKFYGKQFGVPIDFLTYPDQPFGFREAMAYCLIHDINGAAWYQTDLEKLAPLWRILDGNDYAGADWKPYWNNRELVQVVAPDNPRVVASLYVHPGEKVIVAVANLTDEASTVTIRLNLEALGLADKGLNAVELEWRDSLELTPDGSFTIAVPSRDFRLIAVGVKP